MDLRVVLGQNVEHLPLSACGVGLCRPKIATENIGVHLAFRKVG